MPSLSPEVVARVPEPVVGLVDRWRRFWRPPEEFLLDAGTKGELLVARIRVALIGILILIPIVSLLTDAQQRQQHVIGLGITLSGFVLALIVLAMVKRDRREPWLPMATAMFDVTLISVANVAYAFTMDPHVVVNSKITFDTYFLALGATALRFDKRVAFSAGLMTIAQFIALVLFVYWRYPLDLQPPAGPYGVFQWSDQISRVILLGVATILNVYIVQGIQRQRELSNADPLTGVFNRRFFDDYMASELARTTRFRGRLAVAMIDVDHFKQFNDRFGHQAGDVVLRRVANAMQLAVRRSDLVARYGGEEFVVLLRETNAAQAVERVEVIRQAIQAEAHSIGDARPVHVTASAGVAVWPQDGATVGDLLAAADRRLFEAKDAGRNRVIGPPAL